MNTAESYTLTAEGLVTVLQRVADVTVYDHEPKVIQPPAITLAGPIQVRRTGVDQPESQVGANDHFALWAVRLYVPLTDPARAERDMRTLLGRVMAELDRDQTLGGIALDTKLTTSIALDSPADQPNQTRVTECHVETWLLVTP